MVESVQRIMVYYWFCFVHRRAVMRDCWVSSLSWWIHLRRVHDGMWRVVVHMVHNVTEDRSVYHRGTPVVHHLTALRDGGLGWTDLMDCGNVVSHIRSVQDSGTSMVHHLTALCHCRFRRRQFMDYWYMLVHHWYMSVHRRVDHCGSSVVHNLATLGDCRFSWR